MLGRIGKRLTYANVMSTIAVFATLAGGTAYAAVKITTRDIANGAVTSQKIRNHTVSGADLKQPGKFRLVGRVGQPPFLNGGEGDCNWSNIVLPTPPTHPFNPAGFYKDAYGRVHLTGAIQSKNGAGGDATCDDTEDAFIFRLPKGYRPSRVVDFAVPGGGGTSQLAIIGAKALVSSTLTVPAGTVFIGSGSGASSYTMDGVDFRAAGPGTGISSARATIRMSDRQLRKLLHLGG